MIEDTTYLVDETIPVKPVSKRQSKPKAEVIEKSPTFSPHYRLFQKAYLNMVKSWLKDGAVDNPNFNYFSTIAYAEWDMLTDEEKSEVQVIFIF